jgi:hypothetical protein
LSQSIDNPIDRRTTQLPNYQIYHGHALLLLACLSAVSGPGAAAVSAHRPPQQRPEACPDNWH